LRHRLFWLLLIGLGVGLVLLIIHHEEGEIAGLSSPLFASAVAKVALLVFFAGTVVMLFRDRLAQAFQAILLWLVIGLALFIGYTYRIELRQVGEKALAELIPGRPVSQGSVVEIARTRGGEFQVGTHINGARIAMVLDTGATSVVLTQEAAKAAGLPLEFLTYTVNVETANGRARAAPVTLDRVSVGSIVERSVPALIAQGGLRTNLLGMSFLNRLESWEVRGDKLVMRGYP
jgi:aspartyl protease family protein